MKKEISCSALAVLVFALNLPLQAAQQGKIPKIGHLSSRSRPSDTSQDSVWREFSTMGYVEGKNFSIIYRYAENKLDRLPALAEDLVGLKVDVIVAFGTSSALAAKKATRAIPIVFRSVSDPIALGLIDSLARPGENITGVTDISAVLVGKRLELLKETVPKLSRVAVLWDPKSPASVQEWKESQMVARELGLQLHSMAVSSAEQYAAAFKEAHKAASGALAVTGHSLAVANQKHIADLAIKNRLPAIYYLAAFVASGGLMFYGPDRAEQDRRVAVMIDKVLKGTKPADIPVEQPKSFEFVINLKAAKQIGLTVPPNVLVRAGKVIR